MVPFKYLTLKNLCRTILGWQAEGKELDKIVTSIDDFLRAMTEAFASPFPVWLQDIIAYQKVQKMKSTVHDLDEMIRKGMEDARKDIEEGKERIDLLHSFMLAQQNYTGNDKEFMTDDDIVNQMKIFLLAGTETSANTLCWALYHLCKNPEKQDKCT